MKKLLIALMGVALFTFTACDWEDEHQNMLEEFGRGEYGQSSSSSGSGISFSGTGSEAPVISIVNMSGSSTIVFTTRQAWMASFVSTTRAEGDPDWVDFNPKSGLVGSTEMTITYDQNDTPENREACICISSGSQKAYVQIKQRQKDSLNVITRSFEVPSDGGDFIVDFEANLDDLKYDIVYNGDQSDWLSQVNTTRAYGARSLEFRAEDNAGNFERSASIVLYSDSSALTDTVSIRQYDGKDYFAIKNIGVSENDVTSISYAGYGGGMEYSFDKQNWTDMIYDLNYQTIIIPHDSTAYFRAKSKNSTPGTSLIPFGAPCAVSGNIMSLLDKEVKQDSFNGVISVFYGLFGYSNSTFNSTVVDASELKLPVKELTNQCYKEMFANCNKLISAPKLPATSLAEGCYYNMFYRCTSLPAAPELPATTLAKNCYQSMFYGCESLVSAPELTATELASNCYGQMFQRCTSLTTTPDLPATSLAYSCYESMFSGCTGLTNAPDLPATTLKGYCYSRMFNGCTKLAAAPALPATNLDIYCYNQMFSGCTSLTAAPELPATTMATNCYGSMFQGCTSLTAAPVLPAKTLVEKCYYKMFLDCTSLTAAPELPATNLAIDCYNQMFSGCTSLTAAPVLPAKTLVEKCYSSMFYNCSNLNSIKVYFTDWNTGAYCTANWVVNVSASGTFTCPSALPVSYSTNQIPSGWTTESLTIETPGGAEDYTENNNWTW